jgi:sterol desaturase/sphingolipid hydroxylase (fatty acid hydroxylase superfamily)
MIEELVGWARSAHSPAAIIGSFAAILLAYAFWTLAEYFAPAQKGQPVDKRLYNILITLIFVVGTPLAAYVGGSFVSYFVRSLTEPIFDLNLAGWYSGSTSVLRLILLVPLLLVPIVVFDFFYYWLHRAQHSWPWFWQVHKLHHTDEAVNVTTSYRHHWTEEFFRSIAIVAPMSLLFDITPAEGGFLTVVLGQWGHFVHANIKLPLGKAGLVVAGPQYHRIHHSVDRKHWDKNFAAFFPLWDIVFGTAYVPEDNEWPQTGVKGEDPMPGISEVLFGPVFAWHRAIGRSAARFSRIWRRSGVSNTGER